MNTLAPWRWVEAELISGKRILVLPSYSEPSPGLSDPSFLTPKKKPAPTRVLSLMTPPKESLMYFFISLCSGQERLYSLPLGRGGFKTDGQWHSRRTSGLTATGHDAC